MRVLFAAAEAYPLAKSGGLADVARALPIALRGLGVDCRLVLPGYPTAVGALANPKIERRLPPIFGVEGALIGGQLPGTDMPVWLVHAPSLFARPGSLYRDPNGHDWEDNARRFAYFGRIAAAIAAGELTAWSAHVAHANDWHAGLIPFYLATMHATRPATLFTIHSMAFQGNFPAHAMSQAGIPTDFFHPEGVEFYGQLSFMKAALRYSDQITTVSPQYAREVLTQGYGCGFEGLLQARQNDFTGILNGVETDLWDPENDRALPKPFGAKDIAGKRICKAELQRTLGLDVASEVPVLGSCSRLTFQKMADILVGAIPDIVEMGGQVAIVGDGERSIVETLRRLQASYPGRVAYRPYEEVLAHRLQAGADILLAPARFEPCGLTQLYALRYGTIPVVRNTGGLADTVTDVGGASLAGGTATGFKFEDASKDALLNAVRRALEAFREPILWRRLQHAGMKMDFSWARSAQQYATLYRQMTGLSPGEDADSDFMEDRRLREIRTMYG